MRDQIIKLGMTAIAGTNLQRLAAPRLRGFGSILMLHSVRPAAGRREFAPNDKLEITPDFLDAVLTRLRRLGCRLLSLDDALAEVRRGTATPGAPFAVLTFDDGYRDNLAHALPVLERHGAPFVLYVATGLVDRTARLWWVELEEIVRRSATIDADVGDERIRCRTGTASEKSRAFAKLHGAARRMGDRFSATLDEMGRRAGVDWHALLDDVCMDWAEIERLAAHPLATIGAHTVTHRRLSGLPQAEMEAELSQSRRELEARLGRAVKHMAFPYGDATAAGLREYEAARRIYDTAVTSCYGLISRAVDLEAGILPRVSIDGRRQSLGCLEVLLSGLPEAARTGLKRPARGITGQPLAARSGSN